MNKMKNAIEAQHAIEQLDQRLEGLKAELQTINSKLEKKRDEAISARLDGKISEQKEEEVLKFESSARTVEGAIKQGIEMRQEAVENLRRAKHSDAEERVREIRIELDKVADELGKHLERTITPATSFQALLNEAWQLNDSERVPLTPLGSWVNVSSKYDEAGRIDAALRAMLEHLKQHKPKEA
jgi:chromosome segregation ATPase